MFHRHSLLSWALMGAITLVIGSACASELAVSPLYMDWGTEQRAGTFEITNRGVDATAVQARIFAWSQVGDKEKLDPTNDFILSPVTANVAAGETQVVRVLSRRPAGEAERYYRVLFDELPVPGKDRGLAVAIQYSLPVVLNGSVSGRPVLEWTSEGLHGHVLVLAVHNSGTGQLRIHTLEAKLPDGRILKARSAAATPYALPGATRHWLIEWPTGASLGGRVHLNANTSAGTKEQDVALEP